MAFVAYVEMHSAIASSEASVQAGHGHPARRRTDGPTERIPSSSLAPSFGRGRSSANLAAWMHACVVAKGWLVSYGIAGILPARRRGGYWLCERNALRSALSLRRKPRAHVLYTYFDLKHVGPVLESCGPEKCCRRGLSCLSTYHVAKI